MMNTEFVDFDKATINGVPCEAYAVSIKAPKEIGYGLRKWSGIALFNIVDVYALPINQKVNYCGRLYHKDYVKKIEGKIYIIEWEREQEGIGPDPIGNPIRKIKFIGTGKPEFKGGGC